MDTKECARFGLRQYPGGIYNFKAPHYDDTATQPTLYTGSVKSFATTNLAGVPLSGVEKTCWPARTSYPFDTYVPFGGGYKKDRDRDWIDVTEAPTEQCDGNSVSYRTFTQCVDGPSGSCWSTTNGATLPGGMPVSVAQNVPHAGWYRITAHPATGPDVTANVVVRAVTGEPNRRVEEWCLPSGFGWPHTNSASWPSYTLESPDPTQAPACATSNTLVKYNTEVF